MRIHLTVVLTTVLVLLSAGSLRADEPDRIDFDIFDEEGILTVWADLASLVDAKLVNQMKDGIDIAVEYKVTLWRPKKLWGNEKILQISGAYRIGYRLITENFILAEVSDTTKPERSFLSLGKLHRHLADSILLALSPIELLDSREHYFIRLELTRISLTSLNVSESGGSSRTGKSAVGWLFQGFLELTDFGRQDYQVESRPFSLSEIAARP